MTDIDDLKKEIKELRTVLEEIKTYFSIPTVNKINKTTLEKLIDSGKFNMFLGYRHGQLETIILTVYDEVEDGIDCNRYVEVEDPQHMKTNLKQWLADKEHK